MSLDQILTEVYHFLTEESLVAVLDISGHLITGSFLAHRYFPEAETSKKIALAVYSGLLPDFDYFTLGLIPHKTATHTLAFLGIAGINAYCADSGIREKESVLPNLSERIKGALASRLANLTALGIGFHLIMDFVCRADIEYMSAYCATAAAALGPQIAYNVMNNKSERAEKRYSMHPCVVVDGAGQRFWVSENTQAHSYSGEYPSLPLYFIPEYRYPTEEGRELVRAQQAKESPKGPSVWERIDNWFLKSYLELKQTFSKQQ